MEYDAKAVGKRIADLRRKHKMTQDSLAEKINISGKHLSKVEHGDFSLTARNILKLSEVLSVSTDYLYTGEMASPLNDLVNEIVAHGLPADQKLAFDFLSSFVTYLKGDDTRS